MTPGEKTIYHYIVQKNAFYGCLKIQVLATQQILNSYAKSKMNEMIALEKKIWDYIHKECGNLMLINRYRKTSLFCSVFNDVFCGIEYENSSQGHWKIDPLNGYCIPITYDIFNRDLGISKDVAKDCLKRLEDRNLIIKKQVMGGFQYTPKLIDIINRMKEAPGIWKPHSFNPNTMSFEEDKSLLPLIEDAQKGLELFQGYYERILNEICEKKIKEKEETCSE